MVPDKVIDDYYDKPIYYYPNTETGFDSVWAQFAFEVSRSRIMEFGDSDALEIELIVKFSPDAIEKYGLPDNERERYGEGYRYSLPAPQKRDEDGDVYTDSDSYFDFIKQEVRPNILLQLGIPDVSFREIIYRVQCKVRVKGMQDNFIRMNELAGVQARLERAYNADTQ